MPLLGNILLSTVFIAGGIDKYKEPMESVKLIKGSPFPNLVKQYTEHTITTAEIVLFVQCISISLIVAGNLMIFIRGCVRSTAALYLIACLTAFTVIVHVDINDPTKTKRNDIIQCMKNLAIIGGLVNCICCDDTKYDTNKCCTVPKKAKKN
eukprot:Tbor_TRINITY_DN5429_c3_g3::TRINITY_DN5429_c3_g3_i3::g.24690::m.24690/K15977/K15977; putative oxidoreductase